MKSKQDEIKEFYDHKANEDKRMEREPLEFLRCKEIISRYLSQGKMEIADIGGATGVFSYWLAQMNHDVHLLDYAPLHIEQAKEKGRNNNITLTSYTCGDARQVPYHDKQFDLVLEMGPLYHIQDKKDRMRCLSEAMRILKNGAVIICEVISRYANLFEGFQWNLIHDERFIEILDENLSTGKHSPADTSYFTTAYFHTPDEIYNELEEAGFAEISIIPVEGFANILNVKEYFESEHKKELLLKYIRQTENIPELFGVSGHFMAIAYKRV
ncbi:MAG: methyltransferase domain-containing protein [Oscillospiraceae bacterium]|nr:methyltransferase domain-containing protein [Oscillospiraceae bacterium]